MIAAPLEARICVELTIRGTLIGAGIPPANGTF